MEISKPVILNLNNIITDYSVTLLMQRKVASRADAYCEFLQLYIEQGVNGGAVDMSGPVACLELCAETPS